MAGQPEKTPAPPPQDVPRAASTGITVLVVDDDSTAVRLASLQLKTLGYEPIVAQDGMQAVMAAMRAKPAAILLDINLPGG